MNQKEPITEHGKNNLEKELNHLIRVEREDIKKKIQEARELGDLKENAEYHAAKEKQSLIEGKIGYLQSVLSNAEVIDVTKIENEKIVFGATVTIEDIESFNPKAIILSGGPSSVYDDNSYSLSVNR